MYGLCSDIAVVMPVTEVPPHTHKVSFSSIDHEQLESRGSASAADDDAHEELNLDLLAEHLLDLLDHLLHVGLMIFSRMSDISLASRADVVATTAMTGRRGDRRHWWDVCLDDGLDRNGLSRISSQRPST